MTAQQLIDRLQDMIEHGVSPDAVCKIWDPESETLQPITGSVYDPTSIEFICDTD